MTKTKTLRAGDKVAWNTPQGETHGVVVKKVTGTETVKGHTAKADKDRPEFRVKSAKTGAEAIHKAGALRKG